MGAMTDYDAIIIGGGHNGLVAAAYLAQAGQSVLVLERRDMVGGACVTEELFPGYRVSSCAYICHLLQAKVIDDLRLREHGFAVYQLEPARFQPYPDGNALVFWDDVDRTVAGMRRLSAHDAAAYPRWLDFWRRAAGLIHPYFLTAPPSLSELLARARRTGDEDVLETLLTRSMADLVHGYFESPWLQGATIQAHDVGDPAAVGSAFCQSYIRCDGYSRPEDCGIVRGGMGTITQAMLRSAEQSGATVRTGVSVCRVHVEDGVARGVELSDGEVIASRTVLSNADPKYTYRRLVGAEHLDSAFRRQVAQLKTHASYLKFHAALRELPDFSRYLGPDFDPRALAYIKICPSADYFAQSWDDARHGRPSRSPVMEVQIPTVYDPTLAPPGHHVMSIWVSYAPVQPRDGTWDTLRQPVGEHLIDTLATYAPNLREAIVDWSLLTPWDLEQRVGLTDGNIRHLDIVPSQFLTQRPLPGYADYRTPITGLYLCGAGTHPGGEVTGAPGHNAAAAVLRDCAG